MTTLSEVYGVYTNLRQILKQILAKPEYTAADDDSEDALCCALNSLQSAMAYIPMEDVADRKIKIQILKKIITEEAEDGDGNLHIDRLSSRAREQLTLILQLIKE